MQTEAPAYKRIVLKLSGEALQERGARDNISPAVGPEIGQRVRDGADPGVAVASEIRAEVILKATKVVGVYDRDPNIHADARLYDRLTFTEALTKRLQIMDSTAFSLCMDNKIPIVIFDMNKPSNIRDAVLGGKVGTLVCDEPQPK